MRLFTIVIAALVLVGMTGFVLANPALLPKHPGYPSRGEFANDTGEQNLTYSQSIQDASKSGDTTMGSTLSNSSDARQLEPRGSSQLPSVQGASIKTEPPLKESTRVPTK